MYTARYVSVTVGSFQTHSEIVKHPFTVNESDAPYTVEQPCPTFIVNEPRPKQNTSTKTKHFFDNRSITVRHRPLDPARPDLVSDSHT